MIAVEHLTKRYGSRLAVNDLSFEVGRGEIVGFLGPNGAGKSTTLRMLTGFLAPSGGRVRIEGIDVQREPERARARFGYLPEGVPLYPEMRVNEYLAYRAALKGVARRSVSREVDRCLELAGVTEARERIVAQLSKGTRQRVGIADALIGDPPLLVLDEPTSGLDPNQMRHVRDLVRSFAGKKTVFLSTHILPEVESSCERVIIVRGGCKVAEGTMAELRSRAAGEHRLSITGRGAAAPFVAALTGASGVVRVEVQADASSECRVVVVVEPGDASVDAVFDAVVRAGLGFRELHREQSTLEDLFAELTTSEPVGAPSSPERDEAAAAGSTDGGAA